MGFISDAFEPRPRASKADAPKRRGEHGDQVHKSHHDRAATLRDRLKNDGHGFDMISVGRAFPGYRTIPGDWVIIDAVTREVVAGDPAVQGFDLDGIERWLDGGGLADDALREAQEEGDESEHALGLAELRHAFGRADAADAALLAARDARAAGVEPDPIHAAIVADLKASVA